MGYRTFQKTDVGRSLIKRETEQNGENEQTREEKRSELTEAMEEGKRTDMLKV